ncbi:MAG: endonuclease MutS2 [Chloroflexota bacterium]
MISEKTSSTLEFDKILARVREHASFSAGEQAVMAIRPAVTVRAAQQLLDQTTEARTLLETRPATHLGGAHDVRAAVRRAEVGSVLTARELIEIGGTLVAATRVRAAVLRDDLDVFWLRRQAERMTEGTDLRHALESTFTERGEILDSASPALRRIRSDIQTSQSRLIERLNSFVHGQDSRSALQEPIVTMRNGRYVVPVRSDSRAKVPGIVHDQSASGQTIFVEPLAVTEMNNRLKELELAEAREIERILQELSQRVAAIAPQLVATVEALRDVDVAFAKAKYAGAVRAEAPALNEAGRVSLVNARHPLLEGSVVPVSVWLGSDFRLLVITGPNTGGKTVALKTVGLLTLMAQAGMHVPAAAESEVAVFPKIFADIGDEQSIEQSLSTFSSHMRTIVSMLPHVDEDSLVLLDELGAGTDPAEGAGLARAILTTLLERGARGVVTTHYSELKTFAHEEMGVENASVEFDVQTLSPTYRLVIGLPGRSQALAIAKRLGMPEEVLTAARENLSLGAVRVENLLGQIQKERQEIGRLYQRAREMHLDARKLRDRVQSELTNIQRARDEFLSASREEAAGVVRELRRQLREIEDQARGTASRREQRDVRARVEEIQAVAAQRLGKPAASPEAGDADLRPIEPGSTVQILSVGQQGTVLSVNAGEAEVQFGQFKMRVATDDLQVLSRRERAPERTVEYAPTGAAPSMEIDVRGWRADDAVREIDQYLHDNYVHGQGLVRIVHGKGTGALRKVIREQLTNNPLVRSHESEKPEQGGDGVTVVQLAT